LLAIGPANLPRLSENRIGCAHVRIHGRALAGVERVVRIDPALKYSGPRISAVLSSVGRTASVSRERHRVRSVLVVVQVAIALVLLVSAGLLIRTFQSIRTVEPGFTQPDHLQVMRLFFAGHSFQTRNVRRACRTPSRTSCRRFLA
jgi:hypothetical protein